MNRKNALIAALVLAVFSLSCLPGAAWAESGKYRFKFATLAPDNTGWAIHIKNLVLPAVKKATDNKLVIKTYWGGVMGDEEQYVTKMRIGQIHGAGFSGQGATLVCPELAVVELPFLFNNYEEVDYIKSAMRDVFDGLYQENGYYLLAWVDQDFDQIYTQEKPIATVEDFKNVPFVTWYGPIEEDLLTILGAIPVSLNVPEVAVSARTGSFDGAIGPAAFVVGAQLYNIIKYINPAKIRYSPSVIVIAKDAWDGLPEAYKQKYDEMRDDVMGEYAAKVRVDNERSLDAMYRYGLKKVEFSPTELAKIKKKTRKVWDDMAGKLYPQELLDELLAYLDDFRSGNKKKPAKSRFKSAPKPAPAPVKPAPAPKPKPAAVKPAPAAKPEPKPAVKPVAPAPKPEPKPAPAAPAAKPAPAKPAPPAVLSWEDKKVQLKKVQKVLSDLGYYKLDIDGIMGPRTFWGIKRYQRDHGLAVNGEVDPALLKSMGIE